MTVEAERREVWCDFTYGLKGGATDRRVIPLPQKGGVRFSVRNLDVSASRSSGEASPAATISVTVRPRDRPQPVEASLFALPAGGSESDPHGFTGLQTVSYGEPPNEVAIRYFCKVP